MEAKVNEIQIHYHEIPSVFSSGKIVTSQDAFILLWDTWNQDTIGLLESFRVVLLTNSNQVKGIFDLSIGGITGTLVDVRILMAVALKSLSTAMVLAHNHPSGQLRPSRADQQITRKIKKAAATLDIRVLDHLILSPNQTYFSFADEGMI
ncbi:JAB domain-containing protein [Robiginitalea sp. M366]|uniref:JAB domain-containing protein n=1 Tax=Robiginitalea aestuariiviva TaxID=3036903 RepID=UPI00240D270B|nr:JAB domain-containing protein [Robiginitalea aestuariiviva]MDG1573293.1 JAB domain-containing protein [Robiginitalea aestuariiviva]